MFKTNNVLQAPTFLLRKHEAKKPKTFDCDPLQDSSHTSSRTRYDKSHLGPLEMSKEN